MNDLLFIYFFYCLISAYFFFFFFFQAEDGIRCRTVTGVQTCALPIFGYSTARSSSRYRGCPPSRGPPFRRDRFSSNTASAECGVRSAECKGEHRATARPFP